MKKNSPYISKYVTHNVLVGIHAAQRTRIIWQDKLFMRLSYKRTNKRNQNETALFGIGQNLLRKMIAFRISYLRLLEENRFFR